VTTRADAEKQIDSWQPELVLLDIDMDDLAGVQAVEAWKRRTPGMPIIGLTRRGTIESRLEAFQGGIDDLLVIPFAPEELVARSIGVMQRVHQRVVTFLPQISVGALVIDLLHQRLRANSHELELTPIETAILYLLAANAGEVITRDQLLGYIWGFDPDIGSNLIDRHIVNLRRKLGDDKRVPRFIETVAGQGYRFHGPPRKVVSAAS
jgi:DNA-binding response OmpR family regulator